MPPTACDAGTRNRGCPGRLKVALVGLGVVIAMSWLIWAALVHSRPAVAAQVAAYTVTSDTAISVTISVDRRDPSVPVTCRLIAQAADFQPVAEQQVRDRSEHSTGGRQADRADDDPPGDIGRASRVASSIDRARVVTRLNCRLTRMS